MSMIIGGLVVAASAQDWPLSDLTSVSWSGTETSTFNTPGTPGNTTTVATIAGDVQFKTSSPHCDFRSRGELNYTGTIGIDGGSIETTDPVKGTYTSTIFSKSTAAGTSCHVTGPQPFPDADCANPYGGQNFSFVATRACPAGSKFSTCDVWTQTVALPGGESVQSFSFASGTSVAVQSQITSTVDGTKVYGTTAYDRWEYNMAIPASAWVTPARWGPCQPEQKQKHPRRGSM
jgi:hypothetical protein